MQTEKKKHLTRVRVELNLIGFIFREIIAKLMPENITLS